MIYFWSKYNNITMDFSDFSEFIGPIIFGLIAWLSNYFGKKKKPSKDGQRDNINQNENEETKNRLVDIRNRIVELCGDLPRIELFARQKVKGWDYWGDHV